MCVGGWVGGSNPFEAAVRQFFFRSCTFRAVFVSCPVYCLCFPCFVVVVVRGVPGRVVSFGRCLFLVLSCRLHRIAGFLAALLHICASALLQHRLSSCALEPPQKVAQAVSHSSLACALCRVVRELIPLQWDAAPKAGERAMRARARGREEETARNNPRRGKVMALVRGRRLLAEECFRA